MAFYDSFHQIWVYSTGTTFMRLICIMIFIQMADPGGRGHGSARRGALHPASGFWVPERALPHHQPQWLPGANSPWGPQTSTWRWGRGKREEGGTPGEDDVCCPYVQFKGIVLIFFLRWGCMRHSQCRVLPTVDGGRHALQFGEAVEEPV